ncbi:MAG: PQQ-binding-like beta-propeller repeat protein [Acidobacteriota bacterium]
MFRNIFRSVLHKRPRISVLTRSGLLLTLLLTSYVARSENWPQFRGPSSSGISDESELPVQCSPEENIQWKAVLAGAGTSSPIVWEDKVFVTSQKGRVPIRQTSYPQLERDDQSLAHKENPISGNVPASSDGDEDVQLIVEAFRISDGKQLWESSIDATGEFPEFHEKHNLATPTPVTDGNRVYAWFGTGQLVALDMNGHLLWSRHLGLEYAPFTTRWGHGSSPTLYNDTILLLCDHTGDSYLLALDAKTGKERWKADRGMDHISHATPLVIRAGARDELIINSSERIDAYDPADGTLLWYADKWRQTPVPTPVFHNGLLFMSRGYRNSDFLAIRPGGKGDVTSENILWRTSGGASYVPSILYYRDLLYVTNEVGIVTCAEASTGKTVWKKRLGGIFFASPVAGDGKVYLVGETGETFVLKAGREPVILSTNSLDERILASPAISQGRLFLRSDGSLFCIGK